MRSEFKERDLFGNLFYVVYGVWIWMYVWI